MLVAWLVAREAKAVAGMHDGGMDAPSGRDGAEQTTSSQQGCTAPLFAARCPRRESGLLDGQHTRRREGKEKHGRQSAAKAASWYTCVVKSYCREGTAPQEKIGSAQMKGYHPSRERMRPPRRGRGAGWRTQILLATLLGTGGGVAAVRITGHPASPPAMSLIQPDASSPAHTPAVPYATAAALLSHFPSAHARTIVRLRNGNLLLVIKPVSRRRQATHALPTHPNGPRKSITP